MKKRTKLWTKRISAVSMAVMIVLMSFFPIVTFAEGNFQPGTFSPGTFKPGSFKPGEFSPGEFSPGEFNPGQFTPGEFSPGDFQPGNFSPGEFSPEDFAPGDGTQPGQFTPGDTTPGNFTDGGPGTNPGGNYGDPTQSTTNPPTIDNPTNDTQDPAGNSSENSKDNSNKQGQGDSNSEDPKKYPFSDDPAYQAFKLITNDMLFPAIKGLDKHTLIDIDWDRYDQNMNKSIAKGILKNQLGDMFKGDSLLSGLGNLGLDAWSGVDHAKHLSGFFNSWTNVKDALSTIRTTGGSFSGAASGSGSILSKITKPFDMGTGIAGKAAPWMAAISTGISGAETIMHFSNGDNVDGFASLGETLMSGAVVLSATGVGAPIAAGVAVAGGLLWAGAMVVKHKDTVVKAAKAVGNGVKKAAKAVGDAVKGGIDVVKSGFKKIAGWFG
jgi:hypothetical protein